MFTSKGAWKAICHATAIIWLVSCIDMLLRFPVHAQPVSEAFQLRTSAQSKAAIMAAAEVSYGQQHADAEGAVPAGGCLFISARDRNVLFHVHSTSYTMVGSCQRRVRSSS